MSTGFQQLVVVFAGAQVIEGYDEGPVAAVPAPVSILESCLVDWASKSRMRVKVTVRISHAARNQEVELEVRQWQHAPLT